MNFPNISAFLNIRAQNPVTIAVASNRELITVIIVPESDASEARILPNVIKELDLSRLVPQQNLLIDDLPFKEYVVKKPQEQGKDRINFVPIDT